MERGALQDDYKVAALIERIRLREEGAGIRRHYVTLEREITGKSWRKEFPIGRHFIGRAINNSLFPAGGENCRSSVSLSLSLSVVAIFAKVDSQRPIMCVSRNADSISIKDT